MWAEGQKMMSDAPVVGVEKEKKKKVAEAGTSMCGGFFSRMDHLSQAGLVLTAFVPVLMLASLLALGAAPTETVFGMPSTKISNTLGAMMLKNFVCCGLQTLLPLLPWYGTRPGEVARLLQGQSVAHGFTLGMIVAFGRKDSVPYGAINATPFTILLLSYFAQIVITQTASRLVPGAVDVRHPLQASSAPHVALLLATCAVTYRILSIWVGDPPGAASILQTGNDPDLLLYVDYVVAAFHTVPLVRMLAFLVPTLTLTSEECARNCCKAHIAIMVVHMASELCIGALPDTFVVSDAHHWDMGTFGAGLIVCFAFGGYSCNDQSFGSFFSSFFTFGIAEEPYNEFDTSTVEQEKETELTESLAAFATGTAFTPPHPQPEPVGDPTLPHPTETDTADTTAADAPFFAPENENTPREGLAARAGSSYKSAVEKEEEEGVGPLMHAKNVSGKAHKGRPGSGPGPHVAKDNLFKKSSKEHLF